jgi:hypothetical protein
VLEDGLKDMEKCVKALQNNNTEEGIKQYQSAQAHLDDAAVALWSTG